MAGKVYTVEIVGAVSGSERDHPPWHSEDHAEFLAYCLQLVRDLQRQPNSPTALRLSGGGYEGEAVLCDDVRGLVYLYGDERESLMSGHV